MLLTECERAGVDIMTDCDVSAVNTLEPDDRDGRYAIVSNDEIFVADSLVIATGGLSIPKMGATDFGYRLARQFGLNVLETRAGLVPFTFTGAMHELMERLSGLSVPAVLSSADGATSFAENVLFTHRGLSGPAALQLSSYWRPGEDVLFNLLPDREA